jgi:GNAT superfamily N-acetyltransferase
VIEVRELDESALARVDAVLPLHRLDPERESTYLVAWEDDEPVGHVHLAWRGTKLGVPELQDMFVLPARRRCGVGTALTREAERLIAAQGQSHCSLSVSQANPEARRLYERLGYMRADVPPERVRGTIMLRGEPFEVDDTLLYFSKALPPVDFASTRSS